MKFFLSLFLSILTHYAFSQTPFSLGWNNNPNVSNDFTPPPDSTYVRNEIIIKFRPQALRLNLLCYEYPGQPIARNDKDVPLTIPGWFLSGLIMQRFYVDDLIADSSLLQTIKSFGGDTLRRITTANPCVDTISISRNGDTLHSEDYLWMVLHINNDTSVIIGCYSLLFYHFNLVELAQPNFYLYLDRVPIDDYFAEQNNYDFGATGIARAWDFSVGNENVLIGVIDDGVDWRHCEFRTQAINGELNGDYKIAYGWTWDPENGYFCNSADMLYYGNSGGHGTAICGIIGALTNRLCTTGASGMAGIAGGWGDPVNPDEGPIGCKLFVERVTSGLGEIAEDNVIGSIRELASHSPHSNYGKHVHIINISLGFKDCQIDQGLRSAVNYAYSHGVSVICSRGNYGPNTLPQNQIAEHLPATITPQNWVISVGGSNVNPNEANYKNKAHDDNGGSMYGLNMDFIAPNYARYTTELDNNYKNPFGGTSAAAAHTSGVLGLLRSYCLERGWQNLNLEPEDYEGMLKASCLDRNQANPDFNYRPDYDLPSGWGHLQADNLFEMLQKGYTITHYTINYNNSYNRQSVKLNKSSCFFTFVQGTPPANRWDPPETDIYLGDVYEYSGSFDLPADKWIIDDQNKLYVWGRSGGADGPGGYPEPEPSGKTNSPYNPIYWTGFTKVTSGTGGNGFVDGIIHSHSLTVKFALYQYNVRKEGDQNYHRYPETQDLRAYISVFGLERPSTSTVRNSGIISNQLKAFVSQDIENSYVNLFFTLDEASEAKIYVYNTLGKLVMDFESETYPSGTNTKTIKTNNLENGIYFIKIIANGKTQLVKFVVVK